jgi:hypothetical protein
MYALSSYLSVTGPKRKKNQREGMVGVCLVKKEAVQNRGTEMK